MDLNFVFVDDACLHRIQVALDMKLDEVTTTFSRYDLFNNINKFLLNILELTVCKILFFSKIKILQEH